MSNMLKKEILAIFFLITLLYNQVNAQEPTWKFETIEEINRKKQIKRDSIMKILKHKLEVSIGYGPFYQTSYYRTEETNTTFSFPDKTNNWQFDLAWHPYEKWEIDIKLAYRAVKSPPETPNLFSILEGDEIVLEGEGGGMIPVLFGTKYYLLKSRFRPYIGISGGICKAKSQFI